MRKTKIICTLGPAVDSPEVLERLILAGMNVGRINFSHGNYQDQEERIENFKKVRAKVGKKVSLMLDTKKCGTWSKKNNTCRDGKKHCKI